LIRTGIATLLLPESDIKLVGEASNGREAIAKFRECQPDVTLMELRMPEMSGFDGDSGHPLGMVWGEQLIDRVLARKQADTNTSSTQNAASRVFGDAR
jgi:hypothetical protein